MASFEEVERFLKEFKVKMGIWDVLFTHREKNIQTLADLDITPIYRKQILEELENYDYSEGPIPDSMMGSESIPKTHKTKNVSFGDIFHFFNSLMLRHH